MQVVCATCGKYIGVKAGERRLISHSICKKCREDVRKEVAKYKKGN